MQIQDLDTMGLRESAALQAQLADEVAAGADERLLLVEHPPVLSVGSGNHPLDNETLRRLRLEAVPVDRGGGTLLHLPGQLAVYPIIRLSDHGLTIESYLRTLADALTAALLDLRAIPPERVSEWRDPGGLLEQVAAVGVRVHRGVTMHGLFLNVEPDVVLVHQIETAKLPIRPSSSLQKILSHHAPSFAAVKAMLAAKLKAALRRP